MVHGGGHHHHSGGSGGGFHRSSQQQRTGRDTWVGSGWGGGGWGGWNQGPNVVVISNDRGGWWRDPWSWQTYQHNYQAPPIFVRQGASDSENCEPCCRRCCAGCCVGWSVMSLSQRGGCGCPWSFLSVLVLIVLVALSGMDETWTLNAGETRQVRTEPFFTDRIHIESQVPNGVEVFNIKGTCPPLTGHTVPFDQSWPIHLAPDDFQFDYFYLNKGSTITLTYQQDNGATNVSILKGAGALHALGGGDIDTGSSLVSRYAGASQQVVVEYSVPKTDTYVVLYDNGSTFSGKATSTIHIDLTTYNLDKQAPYADCQPLTCSVLVRGNSCLLIQSQSEMTIHVKSTRRWFLIGGLSLIPALIGLWSYRGRAESEQGALPPPSTNPDASIPTAPPETIQADVVDYETIPIVTAENVVPIAVPVGSSKD